MATVSKQHTVHTVRYTVDGDFFVAPHLPESATTYKVVEVVVETEADADGQAQATVTLRGRRVLVAGGDLSLRVTDIVFGDDTDTDLALTRLGIAERSGPVEA